jgi:hypothetical protein
MVHGNNVVAGAGLLASVGAGVVAGVGVPVGSRVGAGVALVAGDCVPSAAGGGLALGVGAGATGGTTPTGWPWEAGLGSTPRGTLQGPVSTWAGEGPEEAPGGCWLVLDVLTELAGLTYW